MTPVKWTGRRGESHFENRSGFRIDAGIFGSAGTGDVENHVFTTFKPGANLLCRGIRIDRCEMYNQARLPEFPGERESQRRAALRLAATNYQRAVRRCDITPRAFGGIGALGLGKRPIALRHRAILGPATFRHMTADRDPARARRVPRRPVDARLSARDNLCNARSHLQQP